MRLVHSQQHGTIRSDAHSHHAHTISQRRTLCRGVWRPMTNSPSMHNPAPNGADTASMAREGMRVVVGENEDGVVFELPSAAHADVAWMHNEHLPGAATPLEISIRDVRVRTLHDGFPDSIMVNGYGYGRGQITNAGAGPFDPSIVANWRAARMPAVDAVIAEYEAFDPASIAPGDWRTALAEPDVRFWLAFGGVHRDTVGQVLPAAARWLDLYAERFGDDSRDDALAMLAGFANESGRRTSALWNLSRIAATDSSVLDAVASGIVSTGDTAAAAAFRTGFQTLLEQFGSTTIMHLMDLPTWREDPAVPLSMIAAMAGTEPGGDPLVLEAHAIERRHVLEAELKRLEADGDPALPALREVLAVAQYLAPASEDHNLLCDQRMIAAARGRFLRVGAVLTARGLAAAGDVFYLTFDELVDWLEESRTVPAEVIAQRRTELARWRTVSPPTRLGAQSAVVPDAVVLRGTAGSAGVYRGRARVLASLEDAGSLESGDVLVCPATAPEWTPYFSVIGALVSDVGGVLTHAAVVAREFGIPAVVGAAGATAVIPDGAFVTVDGSRGLVTVER